MWRGPLDLDGPDQSVWLDLLAADHDNFVRQPGMEPVRRPAGADTAAESALALAAALAPFWKIRGYNRPGVKRWLDTALAGAGPTSRSAAACGRARRGRIAGRGAGRL